MKGSKKGISLISIISILLLAVISISAVSCSNGSSSTTSVQTSSTSMATAKPIKLVFSFFEPDTSTTWTQALKPWFADIEKRSGGKVQIESHLNGELVGLVDSYTAVIQGTVDMAFYFPSMNPEKFPLMGVVENWGYETFHTRLSRTAWDLFKQFPQMAAQGSDTRLLWFGMAYSQGIVTAKKPITKFADMQGLKVASSGKHTAARAAALGLVPTSLPPEAIVTSLQTGVIDGLVSGAWQLRDLNWGSVIKYFAVPAMISDSVMCCFMNLETWNNLPPDIQKIFNDTFEENIDKWDTVKTQVEKERTAALYTEFGITVNEFSQDDLKKMAAADAPVQAAFVDNLESKGYPGKALYARYQELEKQYFSPTNPFK